MNKVDKKLSPKEILANKNNLICNCPQKDCEWHGNCKECIALHRYHATIPECLDIVGDKGTVPPSQMIESFRLLDKEYEELSLEYEKNLPVLSGNLGYLTKLHE